MNTCSTCKFWAEGATKTMNACKRIVELHNKNRIDGEAHVMSGVLYTPPDFSCSYHYDKIEKQEEEPEIFKISTLLRDSFS